MLSHIPASHIWISMMMMGVAWNVSRSKHSKFNFIKGGNELQLHENSFTIYLDEETTNDGLFLKTQNPTTAAKLECQHNF